MPQLSTERLLGKLAVATVADWVRRERVVVVPDEVPRAAEFAVVVVVVAAASAS